MLSLVVPVYNEGPNIAHLFKAIAAQIHSPHEILIVYDFEDDDTLPVIRAQFAGLPHLRLVRNPRRGALEAIKTGLQSASGDAAVVLMADLADDLRVVDAMYALIQDGCDIVCGSRYMPGGRQIGGPLLKGLMSRVAGVSAHWISGVPTHDITNSFKMYSRRVRDRIPVESTGGFELGLELLTKAYMMGLRITEVPATWTDRTAGQSNFKLVAWLPHYLHWYAVLLGGGMRRRLGLRAAHPAEG